MDPTAFAILTSGGGLVTVMSAWSLAVESGPPPTSAPVTCTVFRTTPGPAVLYVAEPVTQAVADRRTCRIDQSRTNDRLVEADATPVPGAGAYGSRAEPGWPAAVRAAPFSSRTTRMPRVSSRCAVVSVWPTNPVLDIQPVLGAATVCHANPPAPSGR